MSETITSSQTSGVTLTSATTPLTVTSSGTIATDTSIAVYGSGNNDWAIYNSGKIVATGTYAIELSGDSKIVNSGSIGGNGGVHLQQATVTNNAGATLYANNDNALTFSTGSIINHGRIGSKNGQGIIVEGTTASIDNYGVIFAKGAVGVDIYGINAQTGFSITNMGSIQGADYGIRSKSATYVKNTGSIYGANYSIKVNGGTVVNSGHVFSSVFGHGITNIVGAIYNTSAGTIDSAGQGFALTQGTVTNDGKIVAGVAGGVIGNGTIINNGYVASNILGLYGTLGASTIINSGTITVLNGGNLAVYFRDSVASQLILDQSSVLHGYVVGGSGTNTLELARGGTSAGTLANFGVTETIVTAKDRLTAANFVNFGTIDVDAGADWVFAATDTIAAGVTLSDSGTLINLGTIATTVTLASGAAVFTNAGTLANAGGVGVDLTAGGTVIDAGTISGSSYAIRSQGSAADRVVLDPGAVIDGMVKGGSGANTLELAAGTAGQTGTLSILGSVQNFGTLAVDRGASWDIANTIGAGVSLVNQGTIAPGVTLAAGAGPVSNSGTISTAGGAAFSAGVYLHGGSVGNSGGISGSGFGVFSDGAANVGNSGSISGDLFGVYVLGGAGTVTNTGTIGGTADAVSFSGSYTDRFVLGVDGVQNGDVQGGSGSNTLELAAGSAGSTGTLADFATFTNFGTITVDTGADWSFASTNTIGTGVSLTDYGTLANAGVVNTSITVEYTTGQGPDGPLTNTGTISGSASGFSVTIDNDGTVINSGLVTNAAEGNLDFTGFGLVSNLATGTISGGVDGVLMNGGGTLANMGLISASSSGAMLEGPGTVTNSGRIIGDQGYGVLLGEGGTITNTGDIAGGSDGARLLQGGTVSNAGVLSGTTDGIYIFGGSSTVIDAGTISGDSYAIHFDGFSSNYTGLVELDPGAVLNGRVAGAGKGQYTLELAAGTPGVAGTLTSFASQFVNFGTIRVDPNADWSLAGSGETIAAGVSLGSGAELSIGESGTVALTGMIFGTGTLVQAGSGVTQLAAADGFSGGVVIDSGTLDVAAGAKAGTGTIAFAGTGGTLEIGGTIMPSNTIAGFKQGDTISLANVAYDPNGTATLMSNDVLAVHENGKTYDLQLDRSQSYAGDEFILSDPPLATNITVESVCFCTGTRIRTARGGKIVDLAVEALRVGDLAVTASGEERPIKWIGQRTLRPDDCAKPWDVHPVRIRAGAFGAGLPERELRLSPGHPVLVGSGANEHLVPIMCLINGTTIERVPVETVTYWHVELDAHDILLAEGLPAESYIDLGSRPWFAGADGALYDPDMASPGMPGRCRPVAMDGAAVDAERRRLDALFATSLAAACGWPAPGELAVGA